MNKKIRNILIPVLIIIVLLAIHLITNYANRPKELADQPSKYCKQINKLVNSKKDFVIFVDKQSLDPDENEAINEFSNNHAKLDIVRIPREELNKKCLVKILTDIGMNEIVNDKSHNTVIFYNKGVYNNSIMNEDNALNLEIYAIEIGFINKANIKEKIDLKGFKEKIKKEFVLIIVLEEKHRDIINKSAEKYIKDIDYEIIYSNSEKGEEIYNYIKDNYKVNNYYPKAMRFKNGKLLKENVVYDDQDSYNELLSD